MNRIVPLIVALAGCSSTAGQGRGDAGMSAPDGAASPDDLAIGDASNGVNPPPPADLSTGNQPHRQSLVWVWVNYAQNIDTIVSHADSFTDVSPALYQLNYNYQSGTAQFVGNADDFSGLTAAQLCKRVHDAKLRCVPLMYAGAGNFGTDQGIHNLLDDNPAGAAQSFIDSMVAEAQKQGFDGYNLDWEVDNGATTYAAYGAKLPAFLSAFKAALNAHGMTLSLDLGNWYIRQSACSGGGGLVDLVALSTAVDLAIIEDYSGTLGGPSASCPANVTPPVACDDNVVAQLNLMCLMPKSAVSIGLIDPGTSPFAGDALSTIANYGFTNVALWPDDTNHFLGGAPVAPAGETWFSLLASFLTH